LAAVVQEDKERESAEEASSRLVHLQESRAAVAREAAENKASALQMQVASVQNMLETTQKVAQDAQAPILKTYAILYTSFIHFGRLRRREV
jgi:hypothetical protein